MPPGPIQAVEAAATEGIYGGGPVVKQQSGTHQSHFGITCCASDQLHQCPPLDDSIGIHEPKIVELIQSRRCDPHIAAARKPQVATGTDQSNLTAVHARLQSMIDAVRQAMQHADAGRSVRVTIDAGLPPPLYMGAG